MKTRTAFFLIIFLLTISVINSQNIQLHFDPRHTLNTDIFDRNYLTLTFEIDKADKWGFTYGYVDLDLNQSKGNIGLTYLEISRDQKIGKLPFMAHIEYNGGVGKVQNFGFSIPNAYLAGLSYMMKIKNVDINTYLTYKYHAFEKVSNDIQWTVRWNTSLCNNKLTISGFLDVWTENKYRFKQVEEKNKKKIIFLSEPQIWYNVTDNLSIGTEIETSNNFIYDGECYVNPTIGLKWNF